MDLGKLLRRWMHRAPPPGAVMGRPLDRYTQQQDQARAERRIVESPKDFETKG